MKIDLHVHCRERSSCAYAPEAEQIQAAIDGGLDGMAFSDHDTLVPLEHLDVLRATYAPFRFFTGIEVSVMEGEHVLVVGLRDRVLETTYWPYDELIHYVRKQGGFTILAHPGRFHDVAVNVVAAPPDAVEVRSNNITARMERRIQKMNRYWKLPEVCCSDAHTTDALGRYFIETAWPVESDAALLELLHAGKMTL